MEPWKSHLFGCFTNIPATLCAFCCFPHGHCCLHLYASTKAMNSCLTPYCMIFYCGVLGHAFNRERIRLYYNIEGHCCLDCIVWVYCPCCAGIQECSEVKRRENSSISRNPDQPIFVQVNTGQPVINYGQPTGYPPQAYNNPPQAYNNPPQAYNNPPPAYNNPPPGYNYPPSPQNRYPVAPQTSGPTRNSGYMRAETSERNKNK